MSLLKPTRAVLLSLSLSFSLLFTATIPVEAAPLPLSIASSGDTITLKSNNLIRFTLDSNNRSLNIPEGSLESGDLPKGVVVMVEQGFLTLRFDAPFNASISPDGKTLYVQRFNTNPSPVDERLPLLVPLENANPAQVAGMLSRLYNIRVEIDDRQRALLLLVKPEERQLYLDAIHLLDQPRPQVMFEAEILEVNRYITQNLGIQYDSLFNFRFSELNAPGLLRLGELGRNTLSLSFALNLLKTNGAAKVLAQPRITTLDGVAAKINATQNTPVVIASSGTGSNVQTVATGITLSLLPKVSATGIIEASITISVSTPTGQTSQGVPQYSSRDASTTVRVANGEPIVIGGLLENRTTQGSQGVPLLSDIPLLGELFKTTITEQRETDLVIIITPRLVMNTLPMLPVPTGPLPAPASNNP
jgi:general secretion pathway protein D